MPCAADTEHGCEVLAVGPVINQLDTLARELDDPGARFCADHAAPF